MNKIRYHFQTITSTNTWAKENLDQFEENSLVIVTSDQQTQGRGQFSRKWISPPGLNLYVTFCFKLKELVKDAKDLSTLLSKATKKVLESVGFTPKLKWPNDIMLNGKKVAGVLCEVVTEKESQWAVIGLGLNVNMPKEMLDQIDQPATSLLIEGGRLFDRDVILQNLIEHFERDNFFI